MQWALALALTIPVSAWAEDGAGRERVAQWVREWRPREALRRLNTEAGYHLACAMLCSPDAETRRGAAAALGSLGRPEAAALLLERLRADPALYVRTQAAESLGMLGDPAAEPDLLAGMSAGADLEENDNVAAFQLYRSCAIALGRLYSPAGFRLATHHLENGITPTRISVVASYRAKAMIPVLMRAFEREEARVGGARDENIQALEEALGEYAALTAEQLGPMPDGSEEWRYWWAHAAPLFTEGMQLKAVRPDPRRYTAREYGRVAEALTLCIKADAAEYRLGDPIRIEIELKNPTARPYNLTWPDAQFWGWGMQLKRNGLMFAGDGPRPRGPISAYAGPLFITVEPGGTLLHVECLQRGIGLSGELTLPEGEYELVVMYDSRIEAGRDRGIDVTGRWDSDPVRFRIKGPPREPRNLLSIIGAKAGLVFLEKDLKSRIPGRRQAAWEAVRKYGNPSIRSYVRERYSEEDPAGR